jgi:hypothetical protein
MQGFLSVAVKRDSRWLEGDCLEGDEAERKLLYKEEEI